MQLKRDYFKKYSEPSKPTKVKPPPTVKPDPAIVTQFKNDEGKQVKIANGSLKLKAQERMASLKYLNRSKRLRRIKKSIY